MVDTRRDLTDRSCVHTYAFLWLRSDACMHVVEVLLGSRSRSFTSHVAWRIYWYVRTSVEWRYGFDACLDDDNDDDDKAVAFIVANDVLEASSHPMLIQTQSRPFV